MSTRKRNALIATAVVLSVVLAAVSFGFAPGREAKNPAAGEHESLEDGGVYVVKTKTYKRHGTLSIEEKPFQLERSKETVEYTVDGEGRITGVSQSIKSDDESKSFLLELTGNRYSVTDLKTGDKSLGARVPDKTWTFSDQSPSLSETTTMLEGGGMSLVAETTWMGREILVYEAIAPFVGQTTAPEDGGVIGLPVVYDLSPVSQRAGAYVDVATARVVRSYRYAIDAAGVETLVESFELLSIEKETE